MEYGLCDLSKSGRNAADTTAGPMALVSMHSWKRVLTSGSRLPIAALLTRTSRRPNSCWTSAAACSMDFVSVTSSWIVDRWPLGPAVSISAIALLAFSRDRLAMMTWKCSDAQAITFAAAKPTPELAPVSLLSVYGIVQVLCRALTGDQNDC